MEGLVGERDARIAVLEGKLALVEAEISKSGMWTPNYECSRVVVRHVFMLFTLADAYEQLINDS